MSDPVSRQPFPAEAARGETASAGARPAAVPAQDPQSPIEREIARSERASAALAATRALARAAVTDPRSRADSAEDDPRWVRTQYSDFEHSVPADADLAADRSERSPAGGSLAPGVAAQQGRAFAGAAMADVPAKTRTGAQAQFRPESRQAPRGARSGGMAAPRAPTLHAEPGGKPGMTATQASTAPAPARAGLKYVFAAGFGALIVLAGGGLAWIATQASHRAAPGAAPTIAPAPAAATTVAAPVAATTVPPTLAAQDQAQAEPARAPSPAQAEIAAAPAAGTTPAGADAAAEAAAVTQDAASAAEPMPSAHPLPAAAAPQATPAATHRKVDVAAAIANAQAKAERFLSSSAGAASAP